MDTSNLLNPLKKDQTPRDQQPTPTTTPTTLTHTASNRVGRKKFICPYCTRKFFAQPPLDKHISESHADALLLAAEGKTYNCTLCMKVYRSKLGLNRHMEIHADEKKHVCERCEEGFNLHNYLYLHQKTCVAGDTMEGVET